MNIDTDPLQYLTDLFTQKKPLQRIVALTGAGVSAESGINTFRASDGLWENHSIEDVATPSGFQNNPALVQQFYNQRRRQLLNGVHPNAAHISLANFEQKYKGEFTLVTQNIDNLHERANSKEILHMHGELLQIRCTHSNKLYNCEYDIFPENHCQCCNKKGTLRPHVIWFGEMPLYMEQIHQALDQCDLFLAIGTSGNVYPAAGFFQVAQQAGAISVEVNLEPSSNANQFDLGFYGPATVTLPKLLNHLIEVKK